MSTDIHTSLAVVDDIPGTRVYTVKRARKGYWMNQFAMSLLKADNRERWKVDERAYMAAWPMHEEQRKGICDRDINRFVLV